MNSHGAAGPGSRGTATRRRTPTVGPAEAAARFVRLFSLGATLLYPLVGVATGAAAATVGAVGWAVAVGIGFHVYADVGNDVMDLPIDRTDPRRAAGPLVRGAISPQVALAMALAPVPLLLASLGFPNTLPALGPLVAALALIGGYNVAGKAFRVPVVADLLQGCGWAALVFSGAAVAGGATAATAWSALAVVVYIAMVNGIHGAVRDAENDRRAGARTTALLLGARVTGGRTVVVPGVLVGWGAVLQLGFGTALVGVATTVGAGSTRGYGGAVAAAVLYALSSAALAAAYRARDDLRRAMAHGTRHLFLLPASLAAAAAPAMPGWMMAVTAAGFTLPPLLFGWAVRGGEFDLPSTSIPDGAPPGHRPRLARLAGLWEMTRPGTPLAAAALVAAGAVVSGGPGWRMAPLMAASALAVAAANVFNDRCDRVADAVNRPDRPLIAGPTTAGDADRFVLAAALGAVASAATLGAGASAAVAGMLVVGLGYSLVLRRMPLLGQAAVAALFAAPVLYGAWFAGGPTARVWIAAGLATAYVFAREILKGVPDRAGDLAAGYRTPATEFGRAGALRLFRAAAVVFCAAALAVYPYVRDAGYLLASLVFAVAPTLRTVAMVRGDPSPAAVDRAIAFSGLVFATGVIPLLLLG